MAKAEKSLLDLWTTKFPLQNSLATSTVLDLKRHHVSSMNWKPPGIVHMVVHEEVGDELCEYFSVQIKVPFPEGAYQSNTTSSMSSTSCQS